MASLELTIAAWDEAHWEFTEALRDLPDDLVWKRPSPVLLSVGELAAHVAYGEVVRMAELKAGENPHRPDLESLPVKSVLVNREVAYYPYSAANPIDLGLSTAEVLGEITRIHQEVKAIVTSREWDSGDLVPGHEDFTWGNALTYAVFHVAYHTGQAYSVRHLLGDNPPDN